MELVSQAWLGTPGFAGTSGFSPDFITFRTSQTHLHSKRSPGTMFPRFGGCQISTIDQGRASSITDEVSSIRSTTHRSFPALC
jgi:hypothetical protein